MTIAIETRPVPATPAAQPRDGDVQTWPSAATAAWRVRRTANGTFLQLKDSATGLFGAVFHQNGVLVTGAQEP